MMRYCVTNRGTAARDNGARPEYEKKMIKHLPASASSDEICAALGDDGCVVVDNVVRPDVMDEVARELRPFAENTPLGPDDFSGRRTRRTGGLIARSPKSRELVMHPVVLGATAKMLGHATSFQLHLTQIISIGPGEPAQMSKGSVLFYTGSIYHGGGANRSKEIRTGINITYNGSWLRQEENQYLSVPLDIARTLPVDLLRLMVYRLGAYALGYVDDTRDPIEVVRPDLARTGFRPALETQESASFLTTEPRASIEKSE